MATAGPPAAASDNQLRRNALGLPSALAMSLAFISPTIGVIFISSLIAGKAGLSSPFIFIVGTLGIALMASTLAQFTRRITSAGTFYKFICQSFGTATAFVAGILLLLIVFKGGDHGQAPSTFLPTHSPSGFGGLGEAFVFIVLAFFGFESSTTVAEETRNPRRNLPIALIGSVVLTGLWFTFAMYSIIVGYGSQHVSQIASASAPLHDLANRYIGAWYANLVDLAAVSAIIAVLLAIHTANFRVLYALGRDGVLPKPLGRTHPKYQTPHIAIIVYSIFTLVIGLAAGAGWGPLAAFGDLGYLSSLAILPVYIGANVALLFFIYRRYRSEFSVLVHVIFPVVSSAIFLVAIWLNIHPYPASAPENIFPPLLVGFIVLAIAIAVVLRKRNSTALDKLGSVLFMEAQAMPEAQDVTEAAPAAPGAAPGGALGGAGS